MVGLVSSRNPIPIPIPESGHSPIYGGKEGGDQGGGGGVLGLWCSVFKTRFSLTQLSCVKEMGS